jgi:hypothetical protein
MIALALLIGLVFYIFIAKLIVLLVGKLADLLAMTGATRRTMQTTCIAILVLIPTWDIMPGWIYFEHLCDSQAEMKILKRIDLEEKYFLPNGQADGQKVGDNFKGLFTSDKQFSPLFHIEKRESSLQDGRTGEVLGTTKEFVYRGGWLTRLILPDVRFLCSQYQHTGAHMVLWREVIRPKRDLKPEGS